MAEGAGEGEQGLLSEPVRAVLEGRDQAKSMAASLLAGGEDALAGLDLRGADALILSRPDVLPLLEGMNKAAEVDLAALGALDQPMVSPDLLAKWFPPLTPEDKDRLLGTALHSLFADGDRLSARLHQLTDLTAGSVAGALLPDLGARLEDIRVGLRDWGNEQAVQVGEALRASMDNAIFRLGEQAKASMDSSILGLGEQAMRMVARANETLALTQSDTLHSLAAATQLYRDQMQQATGLLGSVASSQEMIKNALGALGTVSAASQIKAPAYDLAGAALWQHNTLLGELDRSLSGALAYERWAGNDLADLLAGLPSAPGRWPPAVISRRPEPEPEPEPTAIEIVRISDLDWREVLLGALKKGEATAAEVIAWLQQGTGRLSRLPSLAELEETHETYERLKATKTAEYIAGKLHISKATLYRRLRLYRTRRQN